MNASSNVSNVEIANKIASTAALFRKYFPDASVNFSPWDNLNNESMHDTIEAIKHFGVAIKGPLTTPIGGGIRSLNVALRQIFDLYSCVRPCRYYLSLIHI